MSLDTIRICLCVRNFLCVGLTYEYPENPNNLMKIK